MFKSKRRGSTTEDRETRRGTYQMALPEPACSGVDYYWLLSFKLSFICCLSLTYLCPGHRLSFIYLRFVNRSLMGYLSLGSSLSVVGRIGLIGVCCHC